MNELRWYLLGIGVVILLLIYLLHRRRVAKGSYDVFGGTPDDERDVLLKGQGAPGEGPDDFEPVILRDVVRPGWLSPEGSGARESDSTVRVTPPTDVRHATGDRETPRELLDIDEEEAGLATAEPVAPEPERVPELIVLNVVAPRDQPFSGKAVLKALHVHGLKHGELKIFHRFSKDNSTRPVFSVANMVNPGTLVPEEMVTAEIPGLTLFMQLPTVVDTVLAYDELVHCAQQLASVLGGKVKDSSLHDMQPELLSAQRERLKLANS
ncbi:MAG: cell division protein ZipA C-terminal FtsZ-binding domain-containing protein [Thiotrichales bacterium]